MTQLRTISTERLRDRIGAVEPNDLAEIVEGLIEVVG
jgi:mRNA-degrading endonuclease toxin of MazEF toxin-antitoxin module